VEGPPAAAALCVLLPQWLSLFCARTVCARTHRFACEEETWRAWSKAKQRNGIEPPSRCRTAGRGGRGGGSSTATAQIQGLALATRKPDVYSSTAADTTAVFGAPVTAFESQLGPVGLRWAGHYSQSPCRCQYECCCRHQSGDSSECRILLV